MIDHLIESQWFSWYMRIGYAFAAYTLICDVVNLAWRRSRWYFSNLAFVLVVRALTWPYGLVFSKQHGVFK
jgi:hypothetical protein